MYCIKYNMHMALCTEHKLRPPLSFYVRWHEADWVCTFYYKLK